jgi:L-threonylcarbamoyladenylate synthase
MDGSVLNEFESAAERLRAGGLVAFPTETVYGLGADAMNEGAVARVFALKGRPGNNPLIVHVADSAMARRVVSVWPSEAAALAKAFWPGPVTIVLPRARTLPAMVTAGGETAAVRCPDHAVALGLIRAFGGPIVGPSANPSGRTSPTRAEHVREGFAEAVSRGEVMVLDGGPCRAGIESTVVRLGADGPEVLRLGVVGAGEIERVVGRSVRVSARVARERGPMSSPGMLERHYSPRTAARLFDADEWPEVLDETGAAAAVLTHVRARVVHPPHVLIRLPMDAEGYAARLYAALHEADGLGVGRILIEVPRGEGAVWEAVRDRLRRATGVEGLET